MLFEAGAVQRLGTVAEGTTVSDHEPDEQERSLSINASLACFEHGGREINLIDTPGEPSFVADAIAALRVADAAIVVVNGVMGVEVHTERLWRRADAEGLARLVFVNMLDRERADFFRVLDSLKASFGAHVVATEIPIGSEHEVRGVIDLIDQRAFLYDGAGPDAAVEGEIPDEMRPRAEEYREKLMDEVAENSDELMERYLEGEEIDHDEIVRVLKQGVTAGRIFPGDLRRRDPQPRHRAAAGGAGRGPAFAGYAGVRCPRQGRTARRLRSSPTRRDRSSPTSSRPSPTPTPAGSTSSASTAARLDSDSHALNVTRGKKERIGQIGQPLGKELRPCDELGAGDIGAVAKLKETRAGDVLCDGPEEIAFAPLEPAGSGDGLRLRAEVEGRRGEGGRGGAATDRGRPDPRCPPRRRRPASRSSPASPRSTSR